MADDAMGVEEDICPALVHVDLVPVPSLIARRDVNVVVIGNVIIVDTF